MKSRLRAVPFTAGLALLLALTACGSSSSKQSSPVPAPAGSTSSAAVGDPSQSLIAAAKAEGKLTFYTAITAANLDPVIAAFQAKYGVKVDVVRLLAADLPARFQTEESSGIHTADLIASSGAAQYQLYASKGYTLPVDPSTMPALDGMKSGYLHGDKYVDVNIQPLGIMYNTTDVKSNGLSWSALISDEYKGKIAMPDPSAVPSYIGLLSLLNKTEGSTYVASLRKQSLNVVPAQPAAAQLVSSGEDEIAFPIAPTVALPLKASGAPVGIVYPSPTTGVELFAALASKSAHPSAAKLFLNYLVSPSGQALLNKGTASSPLTATVPGNIALPSGYQTINEAQATLDTPTILSQLGRSS